MKSPIERGSTVCPKAFDTCVLGTLVVMPGFFKRWPKTHWHFEKVAPGGYLGVGNEADGTWLELESLL
ncbi:hypothetical protein CHLRE_07g342400v5 [Chlamydomonas reinhardtii]|uniref:Uncharacterized protein n=1 Tax=Chlamydomonas reinhardtii TaxID=3055 RepID=A0A2K3DKM9_CHLRE|nr:uncharacterized protein CHLRE_07g342400v5 [Chlamydomonas reinhardtii]PNW81068.1 hypothetical protein CHLRE_07g342400v5 [Chlamydomonas reinhardtii]